MNDPELQKIADTLEEIPFPKKFAVELCADCNLNCTMCHHDKMRRPKGVMPMTLFKKCSDEIAAVAPRTEVWFSFCGEPLLEADLLMRMIRYGKSIGLLSLNINTNGMLLSPTISSEILDTGVDLIVIGIDGLTPETYERIRVGGARDVLYNNVEHLLAERNRRTTGATIQVQFIEMDENEHEMETFTSHWLNRGATVKVRNKLSWGGKFDTPLEISQEERIACPWAMTMMHVFWDGRVPRCPGDTEGEECSGNAWHETLATLWGRLGGYRQLHMEHRFDELPQRCHECKDWMTGAAKRIQPTQG